MTQTPQHVAIIMDGNGRWAKERNAIRIRGHEEGVKRVEEIMRVAPDYGVKYLTLYAFSKENWQRPKKEVEFLMGLLANYLDQKMAEMKKNNVIFNTIGDISDLPKIIQEKIARNKEETKTNTGLVATFAFSYSSRYEITEAMKAIGKKIESGKMKSSDIDEQVISEHMFTAGIPDPDLLIRTSGEMRISNFLLWQISYSELYITKKLWPDFTEAEFKRAIDEFKTRDRRFGKSESSTPAKA